MVREIKIGKHYIVRTPGVLGGSPRLSGRRISVDFIVSLVVHQNTSFEYMWEGFEVTPAEIHAALSYYYDHKEEIEDSLMEEDAIFEAFKVVGPNGSLDREQVGKALALADKIYLGKKEELTTAQVAKLFDIKTGAVRQAALKGQIAARKSGATWLIKRADAEARWGKKQPGASQRSS